MTIRTSHKVRRPLRLRGMPRILERVRGLMWRCPCRAPFITYCSLAFVSEAYGGPESRLGNPSCSIDGQEGVSGRGTPRVFRLSYVAWLSAVNHPHPVIKCGAGSREPLRKSLAALPEVLHENRHCGPRRSAFCAILWCSSTSLLHLSISYSAIPVVNYMYFIAPGFGPAQLRVSFALVKGLTHNSRLFAFS